jgi:hypothetical protein
MTNFTVIYDSNLLFPEPLRNLLMWLTKTGLFRARWTDHIHEEWIRNLLLKKPHLDREKLERTRKKMNEAVPDCLIKGYEPLIPCLDLPDSNDRHVLAAAIVGRADEIITKNMKHFPAAKLAPFNLEAKHPDEFVRHLIDLAPGAVYAAVRKHRTSLQNPQKTVSEYLEILAKQQLPTSTARLEEVADIL